MKRIRRIIFNAMTLISLLLCVATVGIWVRSYWVVESVTTSRNVGRTNIIRACWSEAGVFSFTVLSVVPLGDTSSGVEWSMSCCSSAIHNRIRLAGFTTNFLPLHLWGLMQWEIHPITGGIGISLALQAHRRVLGIATTPPL